MPAIQFIGILGCSWYVVEFFLQSLLVRNPNKQIDKNDNRILLLLSWILAILGAVFGFWYIVHPIPFIGIYYPLISFFGIFIISLGVVIRWTSILTLRKSFTVNLKISENQKVIKNGLYRHIRHPSYLGLILSNIGFGLIFCNLVSIALITIPISIFLLKRIEIEEKMMKEAFSEEYLEYMKITKKLIPFIF